MKNSDERGLSLIELMVALAIFAIAGAAVTSMLLASDRANGVAREVSEATELAQNRIETLRSQTVPPSIGTTGPTTSGIYRVTTVVSANSVPGTRQVEVTVTWTDHGTRSVKLNTLIGT